MKVFHQTLDRLRSEAARLKDLKTLKAEAIRVGQDLMNIDLTAQTRKNLQQLEAKYADLLKNFSVTQKQVEAELEKARKVLNSVRIDIDKQVVKARKIALAKKAEAEKILKKRRSTAGGRKKTARKKKAPANVAPTT